MKNIINKKSILAIATLLTASGFTTLGACAGNDADNGYTLPTEKTIEIGFEYTPDFSLEDNVTAKIVDLVKTPKNSTSALKNGSFTPDVAGEYTYVVRFVKTMEGGISETQETITVKAIDTTAPVISSAPSDKTTEVGVYSGFANDFESVSVSDNCTKEVSVYAESIVFDGETTTLGKGVESVRLPDIGEYTVTLVAEDSSGNKARTSYKINTVDTVAPVIDSKAVAIAWAKDGKVKLPSVRVIDNSKYTLTTKVNGEEVTGDTITASAGVYTITYTAKDAAENLTTKEVKLLVKENGVITDFANDGEETLWSDDYVRLEEGKLKAYYTQGNDFNLVYTDGFAVGDWSDFVSFETIVNNGRGVKLTVTPYFLVDGVWKETAAQTVAPSASATVKAYLSDYAIDKVDGVKLALNCEGGVIADLEGVKLSKESDNRAVPAGYATCEISAQNAKTIAINQTGKGVVKYTIYANVACDITTVLNYENGSVSAIKSLKAGLNEITRYPNAEAGENLTASKLVSVSIVNHENYDVKLGVSPFSYEDVSSVDLTSYAITEANYSVAYGESFAIPSPFTSNLNWYNDLTVTLKKGTSVVKSNLAIGSILKTEGDDALSAGEYSIVYSFKDLAGASKTITYNVTVQRNVLSAKLSIPVLFHSADGFDLPEPTITSAVYGNTTVQNDATVTKFYRLQGRNVWTKIEDGEKFTPVVNKTYEIKYVVEYNGNHAEVYAEKFVHVDKYTLDFEPEDSVGDEMFAAKYKKGEELPDGTIATEETYIKAKSRFLFDGGYYDYHSAFSWNRWETSQDWSKSGSTSMTYYAPGRSAWAGFFIRPVIANDKGINAIQFWLKSEKDIANFGVEIGIGEQPGKPYNSIKGWRACEPIDIKAGEHFYTVFLKSPVSEGDSIGSIIFEIGANVRLFLDDVSFVHVERFRAEDINAYDDQIDHRNGYELTKPVVHSDVMTPEQFAKVSYVLTYTLNGKDEKEIRPNADGKYILKLADGEYGEVVFRWVVSMPNLWYAQGSAMEATFTSPKVVINSAKLDFEHPDVVMKDSETTLTLPTSQAGIVSNAKVEYKLYGAKDWIALSENDMRIPTDKVGWYEIRYTADVKVNDTLTTIGFALSEIYVRDPYVLVDFDGSDPFNGGSDYGTSYGGGGKKGYELVNDPESTEKNVVMKFTHIYNGWEGIWFSQGVQLDEVYDIVYVRVYSEKAISKYPIEIHGGLNGSSIGWPTWEVDLQQGWNDVYLKGVQFDGFKGLQGRTNFDLPTIMFDDIALLKIEKIGDMPKETVYGVETTIPKMTLKGISAVVSYRVKGTETWTTLETETFTPNQVANYEIRYAFEGVTEFIYDIKVTIDIPALQSLTYGTQVGGTVTVPTVIYEGATATAYYRTASSSEWTPVTNGSFVATEVGTYKVKFCFEEIGLELIKSVSVVPANELLLTTFETPFDADDSNYTNYGHVNTATNSVRPAGVGIERSERYRLEETEFGTSMFIIQAASWEGPVWRNGVEFGFSTNTFKLKAKGQAWLDGTVQVYAWIWNKATNSRSEPKFNIDFANAVDLGDGWYEYTLTLNSPVDHINGFEFFTMGYYIDDIRAINPKNN